MHCLFFRKDELRKLIREAVAEALKDSSCEAPTHPFLALKQVAAIERLHIDTVRMHARKGKIPGAKRHGRDYRVNAALYAKRRRLKLEQVSELPRADSHGREEVLRASIETMMAKANTFLRWRPVSATATTGWMER